MNQWNFKAVKVIGPSKAELVELSQEQTERVHAYENALIVARDSSVPSPIFSNYFVKGSIGTPQLTLSQSVHPTGNIEYGLCQALHCEETAVAVLKSKCNTTQKVYNPILGFCNKNESSNPPTCCGNCRDILLDAFGPELEIVAGRPNGEIALVSKLNDLLCEKYDEFDWHKKDAGQFKSLIEETVRNGQRFLCDPYAPTNVHPERHYGVQIQGQKGKYFGARDTDCDFHTLYAGCDAARLARRNFDSIIEKVVVVCELLPNMNPDTAPHVMYKDRQRLLGLNLQGELLTDIEHDPEVYLCTYNILGNKKYKVMPHLRLPLEIVGTWKTSLKTWLPFPFSPRNFGKEFVEFLKRYHINRVTKKPS